MGEDQGTLVEAMSKEKSAAGEKQEVVYEGVSKENLQNIFLVRFNP